MKGGVASMVFAAETLARLGIELAGDLIVNTVSEEESTGAGGLAMARTLRADAAIVPEPSGLGVWVACRGSLLPTITVEGRAGHAGLPHRPAEEGGAVNAIEKMALVLEAIGDLRREWQRLPPHPFLSPGDCVPTIVAGGEWIVSYPASCRLDCHIEYLPGQADEHGWGSLVEQEFSDWILRATAADPWLAAHPPRIEWLIGGVPPAEVPLDDPIVTTALGAARAVGRASELGGLENWHDGATLIVEAGIPSICLGPGDINVAHTIDESVPDRRPRRLCAGDSRHGHALLPLAVGSCQLEETSERSSAIGMLRIPGLRVELRAPPRTVAGGQRLDAATMARREDPESGRQHAHLVPVTLEDLDRPGTAGEEI